MAAKKKQEAPLSNAAVFPNAPEDEAPKSLGELPPLTPEDKELLESFEEDEKADEADEDRIPPLTD